MYVGIANGYINLDNKGYSWIKKKNKQVLIIQREYGKYNPEMKDDNWNGASDGAKSWLKAVHLL